MMRIQVGDKVPSFILKDQDGSLNCTREACYFRDLSDVSDEAYAVLTGISGQLVESHKEFAKRNQLCLILK